MQDMTECRRIDFSFYTILAGMILLTGILPALLTDPFKEIPLCWRLVLGAYPLQILYIGVSFCGAKKFSHGKRSWQLLDLTGGTAGFLQKTLLATPGLFFLLSWGTALYVFLLKKSGITLPPQNMVLLLKNGPAETLRILLPAALLAAPIGEELAFRHIIYKKFASLFPQKTAAILSALFFSAAHLNIQSFPALFFLGLYLSYLYKKSGSLLPCILTHALFNAITVGILLLMRFHLLPGIQ